MLFLFFFFFSSRRRHTRCGRDWSSDVCSSDLDGTPRPYLCDNTYVTGIVDKKALAFMNEHFPRFATKAAMITNSPVTKVIISTYNAIFKPKVKFKIFNSEEAAVKWLLKG